MSDWNPHAPADSASVPPPLAATAQCVECGNTFPVNELIQHGNVRICANCKPVFMQKLAEGAPIDQTQFRYAGFWIRAVALFVDGFVLGMVFIVLAFIVGAIMTGARSGDGETSQAVIMAIGLTIDLGMILALAGYETFLIGRYGATVGKMLCRIQVVTADGGKVSYPRALGRFGGKLISNMTFYIGYIIAGFDKQKRALHDHICGTRVIYK
ncbi:MAG TPA: RDD family protein [Opitutales bacterium]|nr:RDD family protein [Opitutales bacterium]